MFKHTTLFYSILFMACLCLMGSCKDDGDGDPEPDAREETLRLLSGVESKTWMISTIHVNGANMTSFLVEECHEDDVYIMYRNGEGEVRGNENTCFDNEPDILATGSWELAEDLETLYMDLPPIFSDEQFEIYELREDRIQLRREQEGETVLATYVVVE